MLETRRNERNRMCGEVQRAESICTKSNGPLRTGIKRGSETDISMTYLWQFARNVLEGRENSPHHKRNRD